MFFSFATTYLNAKIFTPGHDKAASQYFIFLHFQICDIHKLCHMICHYPGGSLWVSGNNMSSQRRWKSQIGTHNMTICSCPSWVLSHFIIYQNMVCVYNIVCMCVRERDLQCAYGVTLFLPIIMKSVSICSMFKMFESVVELFSAGSQTIFLSKQCICFCVAFHFLSPSDTEKRKEKLNRFPGLCVRLSFQKEKTEANRLKTIRNKPRCCYHNVIASEMKWLTNYLLNYSD